MRVVMKRVEWEISEARRAIYKPCRELAGERIVDTFGAIKTSNHEYLQSYHSGRERIDGFH